MKCKLCLQEEKLRNSHIIPEFFYKPLYDDKYRFLVVPIDTERKNQFEQKGVREKLLCSKCEEFLNDPYEKYAHFIFYGDKDIPYSQDEEKLVFHNVDYAKFKLFQLSILWRAGVANSPFFANVNLGRHESIIRRMIIKREPGESHEYGCMLIRFALKDYPYAEMIVTPSSMKIDGHQCYLFLFGGCIWTFVVSRHSKLFEYKDAFLKKDGKLSIFLPGQEDEFVKKLANKLKIKGERYLFG